MASDIFSLTGKIAVDYSDAIVSIDNVKDSAKKTAGSLEDMDEAASEAGESVEDSGESAEKASDGFTTWKGVLSNLVSNTITNLISKVGELASKIVDLTKTAVGDYAEYEQLVGGVETLFKDSSDTLIDYAENAYKTAGLSANDYMETATSFAASLLQGLGGDTAEAVELTNLAITDMSDNANKMGTSMESIQNAYQGFAKQNYTMLDNLKLGYGGTQEEMIRLINDSGILEEEISSLDDVTFDQMILAIHEIQNELGITGTTAEEAGSTISGSWSSIQALFENILTKVGSELAPTIMSFLSQLSEWMESVDWDAFAESVGNAFSELFEWIQTIDFETFFQTGLDGINSFIEGLGDLLSNIPEVIDKIQEFLDKLDALVPIISGVVTAFLTFKTITTVITTIKSVVSAVQGLGTAFSAVAGGPVTIIITVIAGVVAALITLWNTNDDFREAVIEIWEKVKNAFSTAIEAIKGFFTGLVEKIQGAWDSIKNAFSTAIENIKGFLNNIIDFISDNWQALLTLLANPFVGAFELLYNNCDGFREFIDNFIEKVKTAISTGLETIKTTFSNIWNNIVDAVSTAWETIKNVVQVAIMFVGELISAAFEIITIPFRFIWENCKDTVLEIWEAIKTAVSTALDAIKEVISTVWNAIKDFLTPILEGIKETISTVWNAIKDTISTVIDTISSTIETVWNTIKDTITTVVETISDKVSDVWNTIKDTTESVFEKISDSFTKIWNTIKETVTDVINAIKDKIKTVWDSIKSTLTTVLNSIKSTFSTVWNNIKSTVTNVIDSVKSTISTGMNSAKSTVTNILDSIKEKFTNIFESVKTTVSNAIEKIKGYFNFEWSLPSIKLPHFSITGSFSLNPPSVPSFSIEWYKKAMEDGMIMNTPTIFGYDSESNKLLAGGEAGSETVVGTDNLMSMIKTAVATENEALLDKFETLIALLAEYFPKILENMGFDMVLDGDILVGQLAPAMDVELGNIARKKGR